jgi:hypothetical protein
MDEAWFQTAFSNCKTAPKHKFPRGPQLAHVRKKDVPGPGQYHPASTEKDKFRRSSSWAIGTSQRDTGSGWFHPPGPGAYTPKGDGKTPPKWVFGSEKKLHELSKPQVPAPGEYEVRPGLISKPVSMTFKNFPRERHVPTPGPNDYKIKAGAAGLSHMGSTPKMVFGSSSRSELLLSRTPGPGAYELPTSLCGNVQTKTPAKYSIKGKYPLPGQEGTPGFILPGSQFDIKKHLGNT